jgi:nitroimidazol reductase NimA-like FMN-containing flavoprotein (pyridoxamine 5'-phosphate oxidase superfamily)
MDREERKAFVRTHHTAVYGFGRKEHGPAMSVVYYVMDGDDILVWTMAERGKAKAAHRTGTATLCVLDEQWPPTYVDVYCTATVEDDHTAAIDLGMRLMEVMSGEPVGDEKRPEVARMCTEEHRVVLRLHPYMTFETPPRHVRKPDDIDGLTHWVGESLPW